MHMMILMNIILNLFMMSSSYWFSSWVIMEVLGFTFMMFLSYSRSSSLHKKLCMWKYFMFQCISSMMIIIALFLKINQVTFFSSLSVNILLFIGLFMKVGLPPFHKWSFEVVENMNWLKFLIVNSLQKIPPFVMAWNLMPEDWPVMASIILVMMFSLIGMFDWSLRRFLMYSAILNYGWIMVSSMTDSMSMMMFMMIYFWSFVAVVMAFSKYSFSCFATFYNNNMTMFVGPLLNMALTVNVLSIAGMPPLGGFVSKYELILSLVWNCLSLISLFYVMISMIMLVMYLIMMISSLMCFKSPNTWMTKKDYSVIAFSMINLIVPALYFL